MASPYIHIFCLQQYADIPLHHLGPRTDRAAGNYLHYAVVGADVVVGRIIAAVADERAVDEKPVDKEGALYAVDGAAPYAQMSVAPCCSVAALDISQGYVHAADKAHAAVYNAQLAVVAVVDLAGECRKLNRHEGMYVYSGITHTLEERIGNVPAAHVVVDETHLNALFCLGNECVGNETAQRVVAYNIGL